MNSLNSDRNPELWHLAKKRAGFKRHLLTYVLVNSGLWLLWYYGTSSFEKSGEIPWPIWPTLGWGIGLFFDYAGTYKVFGSGPFSAEREYEALTRNRGGDKPNL